MQLKQFSMMITSLVLFRFNSYPALNKIFRMRIKTFLTFGIIIFITSCGCADDGTNNFMLSEFENEIIPFQSATSVRFKNENTEQFIGTYSEKQTKIRDIDSGNDEECFATNIETQFIVLTIPDKNLTIEITLSKSRGNQTTFTIEKIPELFVVDDCFGIIENIEEKLKNVNIQGFEFNGVYDFKTCSDNSEIERIIYSRQNGIEFIDFNNNSYLKLN